MARFTTTRERRLWAWTLAVLAAIYAAAVLAGSLVDLLGSQVLLGIAFAGGFGLTVIAVVGTALTGRSRSEVWVALGVAAVYLMIPVRSGVPTLERTHLFEYGLLAVLLYEALSERRRHGGGVRFPGVVAVVAASLLGWLDEAIQGLIPTRVYDLDDVLVNAVAAVVAVGAAALLGWVRARRTWVPALHPTTRPPEPDDAPS